MKLLNLNKKLLFSLILFIFFTPLSSEDSINIWKNENLKKKGNITKAKDPSLEKIESQININNELQKEIEINSDTPETNKN